MRLHPGNSTKRLQSPPDDDSWRGRNSCLVFSFIIWHGSDIITEYASKKHSDVEINRNYTMVVIAILAIT